MNKHLHRIVFNKARGMLMAVAEIASSHSNAASGDGRDTSLRKAPEYSAAMRPTTFALWAAWGLLALVLPTTASAQIVADPGAPASQRPTIVGAGNGVPVVNIQTPSAAGVSRNTYRQFDVQQQGAILNNARNNAQTQLGGWVQGNPWLAAGTARVILNEVNSNNPSLLRGYVEVAGDRAQVVIANPAGVTCDGCGFINANRATLTTGTPIMSGGNLDGYRVQRGTISITGAGMDSSRTDYTDVIARAVEVNAGIWAQKLNVVAGSNDVSVDASQANRTPGSGAAPVFGIDVSQLGGMYAGKITLIGTEAGVGVRNAGSIGATAGALVVTADGRLENRGTVYAQGALAIATHGDIVNTGTVASQKSAALTATSGSVANANGLLASNGSLSVTAEGLDNRGGQIQALGDMNIQLATGTLENTGSQIMAGKSLNISAGTVENSGTQGAGLGIEGKSAAFVVNTLNNREGSIRADDSLNIVSHGLIDNSRGDLASANELSIQDSMLSAKALQVKNTDGTLYAGQNLSVNSKSLSGDGALKSQGDLVVKLDQDFSHSGQIIAAGNANIETTGILTNAAILQAGDALKLQAATIDNQSAGEITATKVSLVATSAHTLTNRGLIDGQDTVIESGTVNNVGTGRIYGDHVAIGADTLTNTDESGNAPVIAARNRLDIGAQTIVNAEHALIFSAGDMVIGGALDASKQATGQATTLNNLSATIEALGDLDISAKQINNLNEHFSTTVVNLGNDAIVEYQGSGAGVRYAAGSPGVYVYNDESDHLHTPQGNYEQWLRYSYTRNTKETRVLDSDPAQILSGGSMRVSADAVLNDKSRIIAGGVLDASVEELTNTEVAGQRIITDSGTVTSYWREHEKGRDSTGHSTSAYSPAAKIQAISLTPTVFQQGTTPAGTGTQLGNRTAISQVSPPTGTGTIMSGGVNLGIPNNSLFSIAPSANYLVETDPKFASYRTWLSSDYLLTSLSFDPSATQKRLGDGFYEQKLIREQIAQLTGRRFLDGYSSDEAEYMALMNNGATFALAHQLVPGVALTAAQMAALTTDIVWLVEKQVTLPNGQVTSALVPQVYVRVQDGDLKASGALIAADSLNLNISGDLKNTGSIAGRNVLALTAENINNLGGRMSAKAVDLVAQHDLNNIGGTLSAENSLSAIAGNDLNVVSTTSTQSSAQGSRTNINRVAGLYVTGDGGTLVAAAGNDLKLMAAVVSNATENSGSGGATTLVAGNNLTLGTVAESSSNHIVWDGKNQRKDSSRTDVGSMIATQGDLTLQAGKDLTARAATVTSTDGNLVASAGNNLTIASGKANVTVDEAHQHKSKGFLSSKTTTTRDTLDETTALGSSFNGEEVQLWANKDVSIEGSRVNAAGDTTIVAGQDVNIVAASNHSAESHDKSVTKSGLMGSFKTGFGIGKASLDETLDADTTTVTSSTVSGSNVQIVADRNATVTGSNMLADFDLSIVAGQNIILDSARERTVTDSESHSSSSTIGLLPSVTGSMAIYNKTRANQRGDGTSDSAVTSFLSANAGNLTLVAGDSTTTNATITSHGADLIAGKDIALEADRVELLAERNVTSSASHAETKSFTVGAQPSGLIGGLLHQVGERLIAEDDDSGSKRLDNALNLKAGYDTYKAMDRMSQFNAKANSVGNVPASQGNNNSAFGVSVSIGSSQSESSSASSSAQVLGTNLQAENIDITARKTDIHLEAAKLQAEKIGLDAARDVILEAAANTSNIKSDNKSSSASVGVTFGFGQQNGISFQLGMQNAKGHANGEETTWDNTLITATDSLSIKSGNDTTLRGAQLAANQVTMDVGRNLTIETLQDKSKYETEQKSGGFGISLCIPPLCYGASSASVNASDQSVKHNYQSAQGQSGISAGAGGFDITVGNHTDLTGAAFTSEADSSKNRLVTASLSSRDLVNMQNTEAHASSISLNGSTGGGFSDIANNLATNVAGNKALKDGMPQSGSEQSQTLSVISPAQIQITGTGDSATDEKSQTTADDLQKRDPKTANQSLKNTLTLQQAAELEKQLKKARDDAEAARILAQTGQQIAGDIGTVAGKKVQALNAEAEKALGRGDKAEADALKAEAAKWDEGGAYRVALHTLAGALTGGVDGALGAGASAAMAPVINELQMLAEQALIDQGTSPEAAHNLAKSIASTAAFGVGAAAGGSATGGITGMNQDVNNRQLHVAEQDRIKKLANGDKQKEANLTAAACALVRCADGIPENDPAYSYLKGLQDFGQSLTAEQALLAQQKGWDGRTYGPLFQYTIGMDFQDFLTQNKADVRLLGAIQGVAGTAGLGASGAACTSGVGCAAGLVTGTVSADYAYSGFKQAVTGEAQVSAGEKVLQSLGLSPQAAALTYAAIGLSPVGLEAYAINKSANQVATYNALVRASYADFYPQGVKATTEVMQSASAQALVKELSAANPALTQAEIQGVAAGMISSGASTPVIATATQGNMLIKVVPKGDGVNPVSAYWMSVDQARAIATMSPEQAAQALGLPAAQAARMLKNGLDFYAISVKQGATATVFVSPIAATTQGSVTTLPIAQQVIVPNRALWSEAKAINPWTLR